MIIIYYINLLTTAINLYVIYNKKIILTSNRKYNKYDIELINLFFVYGLLFLFKYLFESIIFNMIFKNFVIILYSFYIFYYYVEVSNRVTVELLYKFVRYEILLFVFVYCVEIISYNIFSKKYMHYIYFLLLFIVMLTFFYTLLFVKYKINILLQLIPNTTDPEANNISYYKALQQEITYTLYSNIIIYLLTIYFDKLYYNNNNSLLLIFYPIIKLSNMNIFFYLLTIRYNNNNNNDGLLNDYTNMSGIFNEERFNYNVKRFSESKNF